MENKICGYGTLELNMTCVVVCACDGMSFIARSV